MAYSLPLIQFFCLFVNFFSVSNGGRYHSPEIRQCTIFLPQVLLICSMLFPLASPAETLGHVLPLRPSAWLFSRHFRAWKKTVTQLRLVAYPLYLVETLVQRILGHQIRCYCHCLLHEPWYFCVSPLNYFLFVSCPIAPNPGDATDNVFAIYGLQLFACIFF